MAGDRRSLDVPIALDRLSPSSSFNQVTTITNFKDPSHLASQSPSQISSAKITPCQCFRSPLESIAQKIIELSSACENFICLNQLGGLSCQSPK